MGSGLLYLQFRVGGNGVKSSGPSVRLDLLTFDYKEAMKAGISLTTETRRTHCLIRRPGRQES